jgi:hypothetical protein
VKTIRNTVSLRLHPTRQSAGIIATIAIICGAYGAIISERNDRVEAKEPSKSTTSGDAAAATPAKTYTVLGYPELGMHCMNQDFSEICILPPYNNVRAQVIQRGEEPRIITSGVKVFYSIPGNTTSNNKTNFWDYAPQLFGVHLRPNIGLTGNGLSGQMTLTKNQDWLVTGIPLTPLDDQMRSDPFQLGLIQVTNSAGTRLAETEAVVPVSWEISCNLCHNTPGISVATDILRKHDRLHRTTLEQHKPVLCASCHADPALGTKGVKGVKAFSHAMHGSHATRMAAVTGSAFSPKVQQALTAVLPKTPDLSAAVANTPGLNAGLNVVANDFSQLFQLKGQATLKNACYACHPGVKTECQRDVHLSKGIVCTSCHGDMAAVGKVTRRPWIDEPTCGQCHTKINPRFQYEQPGKLFKDSKGHGGIFCSSCHGPQHAVGPATTDADNVQAILHQGHAGPISKCTVCHTQQPNEPFFHSLDN